MRIFMTLVPACLLVAGCSSEQGNAEENNSDIGMTATARSGVPTVAEAYRSSVRRQNIRHNSRRRLAECGPRQGVDVRRRTCGAASADVRWSVA